MFLKLPLVIHHSEGIWEKNKTASLGRIPSISVFSLPKSWLMQYAQKLSNVAFKPAYKRTRENLRMQIGICITRSTVNI